MLYDNLLRPLELGSVDTCLWSDKCDYIDVDKCSNLNPDNYNLLTMQLNIHSMLSKQIELKQLLQKLMNKNSKMYAVMICETFLTPKVCKYPRVQYNIKS